MTRAEQLTPVLTVHGEGPVWDAAGGQLLVVDLEAGALVRLTPGGELLGRHQVADVLAALRPRRSGGWVLAVERRFALLDTLPTGPGGGPLDVRMLEPLFGPPVDTSEMRMNEGGCDPQGRFWCGSMSRSEEPGAGSLWRLEADGTASAALGDLTISNGLVWWPEQLQAARLADGGAPGTSAAYYIDTPTGRVDVLVTDDATGDVVERRPFATVPDGAGHPDGLTIDAEGGVWVGMFGGSAVRRWGPDGEPTDVVEVDASCTTACSFGGEDLGTLFITTSRRDVDPADEPAAGAVFAHHPAVGGLPPLPYAG